MWEEYLRKLRQIKDTTWQGLISEELALVQEENERNWRQKKASPFSSSVKYQIP